MPGLQKGADHVVEPVPPPVGHRGRPPGTAPGASARSSTSGAGVEGGYSADGWMIYGQHPAWTVMTLLGPGVEAVGLNTRKHLSRPHRVSRAMPAQIWFGRPNPTPEYCHTAIYFAKKRYEYTPSIEGDFRYGHHYEMFRMAATFRQMVRDRQKPIPRTRKSWRSPRSSTPARPIAQGPWPDGGTGRGDGVISARIAVRPRARSERRSGSCDATGATCPGTPRSACHHRGRR